MKIVYTTLIFIAAAVVSSPGRALEFQVNAGSNPKELLDYQEALSKRLELDKASAAEKDQRHRRAPRLFDAYERWKRQSRKSGPPHLQIQEFCSTFYSLLTNGAGCTWGDANHLLNWEQTSGSFRDEGHNSFSGERFMRPGDAMNKSYPPPHQTSCERVQGTPTASEFLAKYVSASRPVIFENAAKNWRALQTWSVDYLVQQAGSSVVKGYVSPDGDYEKVQSVRGWNSLMEKLGAEVMTPMAEDELIRGDENLLVRPAETEMRLDHFASLLLGRNSDGGGGGGAQNDDDDDDDSLGPSQQSALHGNLTYYLCKHSLEKWRLPFPALLEDVSPSFHSEPGISGQDFSKFLLPEHFLLWLGRGRTRGPIHFDQEENLHTVLRGTKRFELFHPFDSQHLYEESAQFYSGHLLYAHDRERGHRLWRLPLTVTGKSFQPFSPVNVSHPDLGRFPAFAKARKLTCDVKAGETLYLPSYWYHEVTSTGDGGPENIAVGINNFFVPWFQRRPGPPNQPDSFVLNPGYRHLHGKSGRPLHPEDDLDFWSTMHHVDSILGREGSSKQNLAEETWV